MLPYTTAILGLMCLGFAIAYNCDNPGHDHYSGAASHQSFQGANTVSSFGGSEKSFGVAANAAQHTNSNSGFGLGGGSQAQANIYGPGNLKSDLPGNPPYWWMGNPQPFKNDGAPGCNPATGCKAGETQISVNAVQSQTETYKMDLSKNPFINGNYAASGNGASSGTIVNGQVAGHAGSGASGCGNGGAGGACGFAPTGSNSGLSGSQSTGASGNQGFHAGGNQGLQAGGCGNGGAGCGGGSNTPTSTGQGFQASGHGALNANQGFQAGGSGNGGTGFGGGSNTPTSTGQGFQASGHGALNANQGFQAGGSGNGGTGFGGGLNKPASTGQGFQASGHGAPNANQGFQAGGSGNGGTGFGGGSSTVTSTGQGFQASGHGAPNANQGFQAGGSGNGGTGFSGSSTTTSTGQGFQASGNGAPNGFAASQVTSQVSSGPAGQSQFGSAVVGSANSLHANSHHKETINLSNNPFISGASASQHPKQTQTHSQYTQTTGTNSGTNINTDLYNGLDCNTILNEYSLTNTNHTIEAHVHNNSDSNKSKNSDNDHAHHHHHPPTVHQHHGFGVINTHALPGYHHHKHHHSHADSDQNITYTHKVDVEKIDRKTLVTQCLKLLKEIQESASTTTPAPTVLSEIDSLNSNSNPTVILSETDTATVYEQNSPPTVIDAGGQNVEQKTVVTTITMTSTSTDQTGQVGQVGLVGQSGQVDQTETTINQYDVNSYNTNTNIMTGRVDEIDRTEQNNFNQYDANSANSNTNIITNTKVVMTESEVIQQPPPVVVTNYGMTNIDESVRNIENVEKTITTTYTVETSSVGKVDLIDQTSTGNNQVHLVNQNIPSDLNSNTNVIMTTKVITTETEIRPIVPQTVGIETVITKMENETYIVDANAQNVGHNIFTAQTDIENNSNTFRQVGQTTGENVNVVRGQTTETTANTNSNSNINTYSISTNSTVIKSETGIENPPPIVPLQPYPNNGCIIQMTKGYDHNSHSEFDIHGHLIPQNPDPNAYGANGNPNDYLRPDTILPNSSFANHHGHHPTVHQHHGIGVINTHVLPHHHHHYHHDQNRGIHVGGTEGCVPVYDSTTNSQNVHKVVTTQYSSETTNTMGQSAAQGQQTANLISERSAGTNTLTTALHDLTALNRLNALNSRNNMLMEKFAASAFQTSSGVADVTETNKYIESAISVSGSAFDQSQVNPLFKNIPLTGQASNGNNFVSSSAFISTTGNGKSQYTSSGITSGTVDRGFDVSANQVKSQNSAYGQVNLERGYLPPTCEGPNVICAPNRLCANGEITSESVKQNRITAKKACDANTETCCSVLQPEPYTPTEGYLPPPCNGPDNICASAQLCQGGSITDRQVSQNRLQSKPSCDQKRNEVCCRIRKEPTTTPTPTTTSTTTTTTPAPQPKCEGQGKVCAPRQLCQGGSIQDTQANNLQRKNVCDARSEVCCSIKVTPTTTPATYLPPDTTTPKIVTQPPPPRTPACTGPNKICASSQLCQGGSITDQQVSQNRLQPKEFCNEQQREVCCNIRVVPTTTPATYLPPDTTTAKPPPPPPSCSGSNKICASAQLCQGGSISDQQVSQNRLQPKQFCDQQRNEVCCTIKVTPTTTPATYLPPDTTTPKIVTQPPPPRTPACTGPNKICASSQLCQGGSITDQQVSQNRLQPKEFCDAQRSEVCCNIRVVPTTTPRPITPAPQPQCSGSGKICAPRQLCQGGRISDQEVSQNRLQQKNVCDANSEVCCNIYQKPTPPPPTPIPCDVRTSGCVSPQNCQGGTFNPTVVRPSPSDKCYAPEVCCRVKVETPPVTYLPQKEENQKKTNTIPPKKSDSEYLPPQEDRYPDNSNQNPNILYPEQTQPNTLNPTIIRPNSVDDVFVPSKPTACAAALKCTRKEFCDSKGVISKSTINLTPEQELFRVPMTDCRNVEEGFEGKCCRDPDYVDPWPVGLNGKYDKALFDRVDNKGPTRTTKRPPGVAPPVKQTGSCEPVYRDREAQPHGVKPIDTGFGEIPWQAMILFEPTKSLLCGGSIIAEDAVITSASCVAQQKATDIMIKGGEWRLGNDEEPKPFQIIRVREVSIEPRYRPGSTDFDVAILHLDDKLNFDTHIQPICIENPSWDAVEEDEDCITTGWGKEVLRLHVANKIMHVVNVTALPEKECEAKLGGSGFNKKSSFCGAPQDDACETDPGAGLACTVAEDKYFLRGIYVAENQCGTSPAQLGTYSKIDAKWVAAAYQNPGLRNFVPDDDAQQSLGGVKRNFRSARHQKRGILLRRH